MKIHIAARTFFLILKPPYPASFWPCTVFPKNSLRGGAIASKGILSKLAVTVSESGSDVTTYRTTFGHITPSLWVSSPGKLNWREVLSYFYVPFQLQHLIILFRWRWMCSRVSIHWNFRMNDLLVKFCWEFGFLCLQHKISLLFSEVLWILGKEFILTRALNSWLARGANAVGKGPLATGEDLAPF